MLPKALCRNAYGIWYLYRRAGIRQAGLRTKPNSRVRHISTRSMACCMHIGNIAIKHAGKDACKDMHAACIRAARQAAARPEPGPRSVPQTLHMRVRGMACCKRIVHGMNNDARMLRMRHSDC